MLPLLATSASTGTAFIETEAAATANVPADRLFLAVQLGARGDTAPTTVPVQSDLAIVRRRLEHAGIPSTAIVESVLRPVPRQYLYIDSIIDPRPYGVVLLRFERPAPELLDTLRNKTLLEEFKQSVRDGIYVETTGAWYALDDCTMVQAQARREALQYARTAADVLARAARYTIATNAIPVIRELPPSFGTIADSPYLCGAKTLPDVPPPQICYLHDTSDFPGRFVARTDLNTKWPTDISHPNAFVTLSRYADVGPWLAVCRRDGARTGNDTFERCHCRRRRRASHVLEHSG